MVYADYETVRKCIADEKDIFDNHPVLIDLKPIVDEWLIDIGMVGRLTRVYYAGGTLIFDIKDYSNDSTHIILNNISTETWTWTNSKGKTITRLLTIEQLVVFFKLYLKIKGKTNYFLECWSKSCVRHLYDANMKKLEPLSKPLIDKFLWEAGITGGKTAKEIGEELSKWSQLNPRFVAEMMSFPPNWTELPFLNGATNPLKDMEMQ